MREAEGFLLVYSITKKATFDEVQTLYQRILRVKEDEDSGVHIVLVGNKCDLEDQRKVSYDEGKALACEWNNCDFYETSAKMKTNNLTPFYQCARLIRDGRKPVTTETETSEAGCSCVVL